jgi:hypothetical protein
VAKKKNGLQYIGMGGGAKRWMGGYVEGWDG